MTVDKKGRSEAITTPKFVLVCLTILSLRSCDRYEFTYPKMCAYSHCTFKLSNLSTCQKRGYKAASPGGCSPAIFIIFLRFICFFYFPTLFPCNPHFFPLFCSSFRFKVRFLCFHIFLFLRRFYLALGCVVLCVRFR